MDWPEALDIHVRQSGVARYHWLCSDDNPDVEQRDAYRVLVLAQAAGGEPSSVVASSEWRVASEAKSQIDHGGSSSFNSPLTTRHSPLVEDPWLPLIRACPDHNPGCCSHPAAFCSRYAKNVSCEECIDCLTADGFRPID